MKKLWVLEEQLSGVSLHKGIDNSPKNSISETLSIQKQAKYFVWLLRHGATAANIEGDGRKEADEPLAKFEFGPDSTVKKQAKNFFNLGLDINDLCIHFDPYTIRDWQTAKIFCDEVWLAFPDEKEMVDENIMREKYPYIVLTKEVATRTKWSIDGNEIPILWLTSNNKGAESIQKSRLRVLDYVQKIQKDIKNKKNTFKHHLLVGHRTGTNWFLDAKYNRYKQDLSNDKSESNVSQLDFWLLNDYGEFINQESKNYGKQWMIKIHNERGVFEFNLQNYQQQVEEFKRDIPKMNILSGNDIISDTNIINEYLDLIKKTISEGNTEEQVIYYLKSKSEIVCEYILSFVIDIIASQKKSQKELEWIVINYLKINKFSEEKQCRLFAKLYTSKHELWKYFLRNMYNENKSIMGNPIISTIIEEERKKNKLEYEEKTKIEQEIEKFDNIKEYENIHVDTLLWDNISLKDFYVQQNLTMDGKTISSDDVVHEILTSEKKIFAIQAAGGSGKTMLSKYLLTQCANTDTLQKNDALHAWVKEINLNEYTSENIQDILQWPENIVVIDALDEKNSDTVKSLAELSNSDEFKNSGKKIVVLGRYIEDGFLYEGEKDSSIKYSTEVYKLQEEVDIKEYITSFSKTLRPEFQEIFKKELSDILSKTDTDLHTPIIIEMLANIVKRKLTSWRNKKIFVDEEGNEKTDITRKDIYDKFFQHLHEREDQKSDKIWAQNERLYQNNPFMGEKYDQLRKEFLMYLTMTEILGTQKSRTTPQRNEWWSIELHEENFQDIFRDFMLYKTDKKEDKIISDFIIDPKEGKTFDKQIHNIELFKETLLATNILKKNQDEKLSFHHKTFEEYFGYIYYENNKDSWYKDVYELYNKWFNIDNMVTIPYFLDKKNIIEDIKRYWIHDNGFWKVAIIDTQYPGEELSYDWLEKYGNDELVDRIQRHLQRLIHPELNNIQRQRLMGYFREIHGKCLNAAQWEKIEWNLVNDIQGALRKVSLPEKVIKYGINHTMFGFSLHHSMWMILENKF